MSRLRFVQVDIPWSTVHGYSAQGFPLPVEFDGWEPFQVEIRHALSSKGHVCLAIWLREETV